DRLDRVKLAVRGADRPRVVALEWLDPPFIGGHWVPQMIELAGGEDPLGFPAERAAHEVMLHRDEIARLGASRVVAVDAAAYFSRPGPRLVEGVELLGYILHPDLVEPPPPERLIAVDLEAPGDPL